MIAAAFRLVGIAAFLLGIFILFDSRVSPNITLQNTGMVAWFGISLAMIAVGILGDIAESLHAMRPSNIDRKASDRANSGHDTRKE